MRALMVAMLLAIAGSVWAQSSLPPCPSDPQVRWHNCFGTYTLPDGSKYVGEFKDGKFSGQGTHTWPDGRKFVGEYKDGQRNGQGTNTSADGRKFVGEYKDGSANGQGTQTWPDGRKHVGEYKDGKYSGQGTYTWPDGRTYVGEFKDGKFSGQGTHTWPDGRKYVGEYKDDKFSGQGTYTWPDGTKRVGEFKYGQHIQGTYTFPNGLKYVGEFKDGQAHGQGTNTWPDGRKYVGEYKDDKFSGQGTYTWPDGRKYVGQFKDGKFSGQGTYTFADGSKHVGAFKDDKPNGQGIRYDSNGVILEQGSWEDGRRGDSSLTAERKKRQELEERLAAESRERERLVAEARERDRLLAEARERERVAPPKLIASTIRSAHALVIGNAAYPGSARLDNPINDANAVSEKLRSMGFTVTTVTDANRQRLVQAMSQFRRTAAEADVSLLFYSGHGVQVFGKNYMLPTDLDQTDVAQATIQGVSLNEVVENFLPGKTKLVFLDACRDNPLQRTGDRSVSRGLAPIAVAEGTLIAYATKDGQVASDGPGQRNSPFTQALLDHIADPNDIAVVLRKVREKVMRSTAGKQQPWEYGSLTGGELVLSAIRPAR